MLKIGVLTISDRASTGVYDDVSGRFVEEVLREFIADDMEVFYRICADEMQAITTHLHDLCDVLHCSLVVTTGGTGPALRDVTPEVMHNVCHKILPGFGELMRSTSLRSVPTAILSRQMAGIRSQSLIVNLPGKPAAIRECLEAVFPAIPYCVDLIGGDYITANESVIQAFRPKEPSKDCHTSLIKAPRKEVLPFVEKPHALKIKAGELTHLDRNYNPQMVDTSDKHHTQRVAKACGKIFVNQDAFDSVRDATNKKGPVLQTAIIAAIMGAKKTSDLIPLCHPLNLTAINCEINELPEESAFLLSVTVKINALTGVEMEALTGVSIGLLTMYDMLKALDRKMVIGEIFLLHKSGGKSGDFDA